MLGAQLLQTARIFQRRGRVVNRAGADHHQQPVIAAGHDVVDVAAGLGDQVLHRSTADRKEADQVFWGGQHSDVLDSFVVGQAGLVDGLCWPGMGGVGLVVHHGAPTGSDANGHKKTAGVAGGLGVRCVLLQGRSDLSTAGGAKEPEVSIKTRAGCTHGCNVAQAMARPLARLVWNHRRNLFHHWMARSTWGSDSAPNPDSCACSCCCSRLIHCS